MKLLLPFRYLLITLVFTLSLPATTRAYSVLTHEALIDASWDKHILPLLKHKYPNATDAEIKKAHAYTYGGCLIADMGYFPFGNVYFTNLSHYVRSGDFVQNLLAEAENLDEYAFALGALCHYMGDQFGHAIGTNVTVPIVYPKMEKKYGHVVTYEENHQTHSRVELSFDVIEISKGNYASQNYHDFIGFEVARPVLERAFLKTYGQDINSVFGDLDLTISTYRWAVRSLMPTLTRTAWILRKDEIKKTNPSANSRTFHYRMHKKAYIKEFGSSRQKPRFAARILAFFINILPKIGPLKVFKFKDPGPEGEKNFVRSFDTALTHYHDALAKLQYANITLPDVNFDTGKPTMMGEYDLADKTYGDLVDALEDNKFNNLTAPLKQNILAFYNSTDTTALAQKYPKDWKKTSKALQAVKVANPVKTDSLKTAKGIYYKLNEPVLQASGSN
jgi:hypothetical protein